MRLITILILMFFVRQASAQQPTYYLNFDDLNFKKDIPLRDSAYYNVDLLQSHYAKGLSGQALDLSAEASLRRPVRLAENTIPRFDEKTSFSIQIWAKTLPNAKMGSLLMGNKIADDLSTLGWQLYTRENGAWALLLNDGKKALRLSSHCGKTAYK